MSRWFKWAYSVVFFLLMCGLVAAGTYQYKDNLSIPYNINLFNCGAAVSCTAMTLQNSGGTEIFTASNPGSVTLTNSSVTLSGSPVSVGVGDGSDATQGAKGDSPLTSPFNSGSVVAALKGILANVLTPISVTGNINNTPQGSPQNVTIQGSPQNITVANAPSPVAENLVQQQGVNIASPSTYGLAPVGSVGGVNAFVTNNVNVTTPTPLNVTVANTASPAGVAVVNAPSVNNTPQGSPQNVTVANTINATTTPATSPGNVTVNNSPLAVSIASSPVNITGNITTTAASPTTVNIGQVQNVNIASPQTYGVAPVGSVEGVNAFVTNSPTVVLSGSPVSVGIASGSSPINVTGSFSTVVNSPLGVTPFNGASPQNVTFSASPVSVAISTVSSPVNVTGSFSTTVNSPLGVTPFNGASPQNVTFAASPVSVAISTVSSPLNVTGTFTANSSSPTNVNLDQINGQLIASPSTYGVAPVGSTLGVNAFITNNVNVTPPTPLQVTMPASPLGVAIAGPTPLNVTVGSNVAVTPPTPLQVTLPASPISVGIAGPTPLNVTIATGTNITQIAGNNIASPTGYGTAPVGSVQGVNAFVTNNVAVTTPTPFNVVVGSPLNVTIAGPTPLAVTLPSTPVLVAISSVSSPVNITGSITANSASPTNVNLDQINGQLIASPQTYGVAPVGSVLGVNAFVTNNVNVTPPTPLNVTVGGIVSPLNVTIASTPLNVTLPASPLGVAIAGPTPIAITLPASPIDVGVNNVNPNGVAVMASSSPVVIASDQTAVSVKLGLANVASSVSAYVATSSFSLTGTLVALGATPGIVGVHQLGSAICSSPTPNGTPASGYLRFFDTTPHASGFDIALTVGTQSLANTFLAVVGSPIQQTQITFAPPGLQFNKGIVVAFTQGPIGSSTAVGYNINCSFGYN